VSEENKPWAIFWMNDERHTGVVWAEDRMEARSIAEQEGGVAAVTDGPQRGGYNIEYDNPDQREHFFGRNLNDTMLVNNTKKDAEGGGGE